VLSDREREILHEMQHRFRAEDPGFARAFDEVGRRDSHFSLQWAYGMPRWMYMTSIIGAVALSVLMLLALAPWTALMFITLASVIAAALFHRDNEARQTSPTRSAVDHPSNEHPHQAWPDHRQ
jgi:hypothetical protein